MKLEIQIDRIVLEGVALDPAAAAELERALVSQLETLALPQAHALAQLHHLPRMAAPPIALGEPLAPAALGAGIASSLVQGLSRGGRP